MTLIAQIATDSLFLFQALGFRLKFKASLVLDANLVAFGGKILGGFADAEIRSGLEVGPEIVVCTPPDRLRFTHVKRSLVCSINIKTNVDEADVTSWGKVDSNEIIEVHQYAPRVIVAFFITGYQEL